VAKIVDVMADLVQEQVFEDEAAQAVRIPSPQPDIVRALDAQPAVELDAAQVVDPARLLAGPKSELQRSSPGADVNVRPIARLIVAIGAKLPRAGHETHGPQAFQIGGWQPGELPPEVVHRAGVDVARRQGALEDVDVFHGQASR
jgi:hypothetical protein